MAKSVKAELSERVKKQSLVKIAVVGTISLTGLILSVSSLIGRSWIFGLLYLVAGLMGALYTVIEINLTKVPSIECDGETLWLNIWDNGIFPYKFDFKPSFFADFIPSKNVREEIALADISDIAVGTMGFLTKTLKSQELDRRFAEFTDFSKRVALYVKRCDIFCVRLADGRIHMMSVKNFDIDRLYTIIDMIEHSVQGVEINTNIRKLRKKRETI